MIDEVLLTKFLEDTISKYTKLCNTGEIKLNINSDYLSMVICSNHSRYAKFMFPVPSASIRDFELMQNVSALIGFILSSNNIKYNGSLLEYMRNLKFVENKSHIIYYPYLNFRLYENMTIENLQIDGMSSYRETIKTSIIKLLSEDLKLDMYKSKPSNNITKRSFENFLESIMSKWADNLYLNKPPVLDSYTMKMRKTNYIIFSKFFYISDFMKSLYFDVILSIIEFIGVSNNIRKDIFNYEELKKLYINKKTNEIYDVIDKTIEDTKLVDVVMNAIVTNLLMTMIGTMQLQRYNLTYHPKLIIDNLFTVKEGYRLINKDVYINMAKKSRRNLTNISFVFDVDIDPRPDKNCINYSPSTEEKTIDRMVKYTPLENLIEFLIFVNNYINNALNKNKYINIFPKFRRSTLQFMSNIFNVILDIAKDLRKYNIEMLKCNVDSISIKNEHLCKKSSRRLINENRTLILIFLQTILDSSIPVQLETFGKCKFTDIEFNMKFKNSLKPIRIKSKVEYENKTYLNTNIFSTGPTSYGKLLLAATNNTAISSDFVKWLNDILNRRSPDLSLENLAKNNEKINDILIKLHLLLGLAK